ncbi:MAG TPA: LPS export ABC transporter periplasmic protein LptC [Steroidobacteraceae bacterium]|nr:LPS export ABC transporter periplasmic protein LptC [Steroidobacteraceae bacterium]
MIFRIFATVVVLAIIAASIWFGGPQRGAIAPTPVEASSTDLGYSARRAVLIETGPDGLPMYTVHADVIRERSVNDVEFTQVQMSFRDQAGQIWTARADHGELGQQTGSVELTGDVHVDGLLPGSPQNADLSTEKLAVDSRADVISTDDPVTLDWGGRKLSSHGMVAALAQRRLLLESAVHGIFSAP